MATVSNCNLPEDLYYVVEKHVWARHEDGVVTVGLTDVAQNLAKGIISVSPKKVGRRVDAGKSVATVESSKWVGPFPAPLSGQITGDNRLGFEADIAVANRDPYGAGWLIRLRPSDFEGESGHLVDGAAASEHYRKLIEEEGIRCFRCEE